MKLNKALFFGLGLVSYATATQSVIWVTETAYTCPCSSSTSTGPTVSASSVTPKYSTTVAGAVTTSKTATTTSSLGAAQTCLASGADCSGQTATYGCCSPLTCDSTTLTCVSEDTSGSGESSSSVTVPTSTATTSSLGSAQTCLAENADCSDQTATYGCCSPLTCDSTTLTCVPEN